MSESMRALSSVAVSATNYRQSAIYSAAAAAGFGPAVVPEPATLALLAIGGLAFWRRHSRPMRGRRHAHASVGMAPATGERAVEWLAVEWLAVEWLAEWLAFMREAAIRWRLTS